MTKQSTNSRMDRASRVIMASPRTIYRAFLDPEALVSWLPPEGMKGHVYEFDARVGGDYRMSLTYVEADHSALGKTSENTDVVQGRFIELIPNERVVQLVEFESEDSAFAGRMRMTWALAAVQEGTEVSIICEDVPEGIRQEDHVAALRSTLENLANFIE
ncbi:ATPase [Fischerella thermalis CCMEE 5273]|nr:ATPase [Fischerella thermalis CCMEE 5273]